MRRRGELKSGKSVGSIGFKLQKETNRSGIQAHQGTGVREDASHAAHGSFVPLTSPRTARDERVNPDKKPQLCD